MVGLVVMQTLLVDEAGSLCAKWKLKLLSIFDYIIGKIMISSLVRKLIGLSLILPDKDDILLKRFSNVLLQLNNTLISLFFSLVELISSIYRKKV